ncbi:MAG: BamA/TamA family outer membrane protein, partial [Myxococcales bacterium]|nr:BamA/TamA family outer membrane protein [Myxococcales bacterium]
REEGREEDDAREVGREDDPAELAPPDIGERRSLRIARIEVLGNEQVPKQIILETLAGEELSVDAALLWPEDSRVQRARQRLLATGNFERVTLKIRPVAGDATAAALIVDVEERGSLSVTNLYIGSSRMTPFRGGLQVREHNFLGRSVHIGGGFIWGTRPPAIASSRRQQGGRVFIEAPRLAGTRVGMGGALYVLSASDPFRVAGAEDDPDPALFRTVDFTRIGGLLGVTFPLIADLSLGVDYRFERVSALLPEDPRYYDPAGGSRRVDLYLQDGIHRQTAAHFRLVWDGRDLAATLGKGGRFALDVQFSSPIVGSEYEYIKLVAGGAYTFRLPWGHWITPTLVAGQIAGDAPRYERFFTGDLSDWTPGRELSFIYTTRAAIDVFGTGIDTRTLGDLFTRFDLEYVWPLFQGSRVRGIKGGQLFLSTGVYTLVEPRELREFRRARGEMVAPPGFNANFGLRLDTVIGTLDLSVGNVLRRTPL